jgi:amino acid adenylation domain-containing protein
MEAARAGGEVMAPFEAVHVRFRAQARRAPDAIAVEHGAARLSYGALAGAVDRLALRLRRAGAGPERIVAIAVERSPELIVALLGVLDSGAAYLPIDPGLPAARRAALLARSGAIAVVAGPALAEHAADVPVIAIGAIDDDLELHDGASRRGERSAGDDPPPVRPVDPGQLAYILYTSGSTGEPKGVMVSHAALANHCAAMAAVLALGPSDRVLQFASIAFDVAAEEIYPTLATGATLVLRPEPVPPPDAALLRWLDDARISVVNVPASYWHAWASELMREAAPHAPVALRAVVVGNEAVQRARLVEWRSRVPGPAWFNAYGPTEATITATVHRADPRDGALAASDPGEPREPDDATVPIGRPIANVTAHVLDAALQPVAAGAPGELFLGGASLARGYLGAPALTAASFVPDPFGGPGARLYRTGDRVRAQGGELVFLGRTDDQVKLRGHRVELGEITAALRAHPAVADGAVIVRADAPGVARLIAYAVPRAARDADAPALRRFLEDLLPHYMVPAAVMIVDALPRGPGGKLDRAALPVPELATSEPPVGRVACELAEIWAALLGVPAVGGDDSFFDLGGNSLIALQIASRVRARFGVALSLRDLVEAPTLAAQAARIERGAAGTAAPDDPDPGPRPVPRDGDVPLSFSQERVWFENQLTPGVVAYNTAFVVELEGEVSAVALDRALAEIVRRHEIFRTTFHVEDGLPFQRVHPGCVIPIPRIDLRQLDAGAGAAELVRRRDLQLAQPFDVAVLPLVRCELLELAGDRHAIVWTEHHFLHDGWSMAMLLRELTALYSAFVRNQPSPLAEPVLQFADYAVWQRQRVSGDRLADGLAFWTRALAGAPPMLSLPADRPRPAVRTFAGEEIHVEQPIALGRALRALAAAERATLYMVMRSAFLVLLHRVTGQTDLVVGTGVAGRQHAELEDVIGMMVNSLALRVDASGDPTFRALVQRVRETTLDAYAWQDIPFHKVVAAVRPPRNLGCNPIFQVDFSFHDTAMPRFDVPGARGRLVYTPFRASKFDLNVTIVPGGAGDPLLVMWQYSTDLFDEASIRELMARYDEILRDAVAHPDRRLSELSIMPAALPAQVAAPSTGNGAGAPPRDAIELALHAAWGEAFDDDVAVRDSFFERGGTSIMAAQVVQRIRQTLGVRLPVTAVFRHDTIAELAEHIRDLLAISPGVTPEPRRTPERPA